MRRQVEFSLPGNFRPFRVDEQEFHVNLRLLIGTWRMGFFLALSRHCQDSMRYPDAQVLTSRALRTVDDACLRLTGMIRWRRFIRNFAPCAQVKHLPNHCWS